MNKIERDRKSLIGLSIMFMLLSVAICVSAVAMILGGTGMIAANKSMVGAICLIFVGGLVGLIGLVGFCIFAVMLITGKSLVATKGSIAQDNLGKGTVNMIKCQTCGNEVGAEDKKCGNCGADLSCEVVCKACGKTNPAKNKNCNDCGEKL